MATDSEWRLVRRRAEKAGLSASEFLLSRGLAPAEPAAGDGGLPPAAQRCPGIWEAGRKAGEEAQDDDLPVRVALLRAGGPGSGGS